MSTDTATATTTTAAAAAAAESKPTSVVAGNIEKALAHKTKGNEYFAAQNWGKASFEYKHVSLYLGQYLSANEKPPQSASDAAAAGGGDGGIADMVGKSKQAKPTDSEMEVIRSTLFASYCNLSLVQLNLGRPPAALAAANAARAINPSNVKALYRRGQARLRMGLVEEAAEDFQAVLKEFPEDAGAIAGMQQVKHLLGVAREKEAKMCAKMFA